MMKKILLMLTLAAILVLAGCSQSERTDHIKPENALIVDGATSYVITRPDVKGGTAVENAVSLRKSLAELVGIELDLKTDFYKPGVPLLTIPDCEILVGKNDREVTAEFADKAPRVDDWLIARSGTKVLIYGENRLDEAIAYFLDNYIAEGNIYIPDGELYVNLAEYKFDALTLGGVDLAECTIGYIAGDQASQRIAEQLATELSADYGKSIKTDYFSAVPTNPEKLILFMSDNTLDYNIVSCKAEGSSLILRCGMLTTLDDCYDKLAEKIAENTQNKSLEMDTLSFEETEVNDKLNIADEKFMTSLEKKQQEMKDAVMNTESQYEVGEGGKIYYVANDGDDNNDGLSPEKPIKTIDKVGRLILKRGDVVLFKRGDLFRGKITVKAGVTYSAWGEGAKPIISGSRQNYADPALWEKTEYENVWVCKLNLINAGIVTLDHTGEIGKYDELVGKRMVAGVDGFEGVKSMNEDLQFWSHLETGKFYFYSEENPGSRFKSIEIGERANLFSGSADDVIIDNLHITLSGAHGVGCGGNKNLTVRNCLFNWLGGSILMGFNGGNITGYGNAVQIYGSVDGYYVYNNWMYQIYDTGITHQFSRTPSVKVNNHNNVEYYDNLIEYCHWSIEYYNVSGGEGTSRSTTNIDVHDNYCRMGGYGWGGRSLTTTPMYSIGSGTDVTENYVTRDNIFENCLGYLVTMSGNTLEPGYTFSNNTYVQPYGYVFLRGSGQIYNFDSNAAEALRQAIGETDPKCYFIMPEEGK